MVDQIQLPSTQAFSGGADFSQLANLGNVYQAAQEKAQQQQALASLGQDPVANAQMLIKSGVPSLATLGLNLQQQSVENARQNELLGFKRAEAARAQQTFEQGGPTEYTIEKSVNPTTGETSFVRVKKAGPEGPIDAGMPAKPAIDPSITGEDFLSQLDPARANTVKAIAEGRMAPPSGFALKNPAVLSLLRDAAQYEPGMDLSLWKARNAMLTQATSGKIGQNIASFNTAIGHIDSLDKSIEGLANTSYPTINAPANRARALYDPVFAGKIKDFESAKTAVVDELTRAFRGTGGNVHDLVAWEKTLNNADSPEALHEATKQIVDLLHSRIDALGDQYNRGMQLKVPKDSLDLLSPKAKGVIQRITGERDNTITPAPTSPAAPLVSPAAAATRTIQRTGTVNDGPNKGKTIVQFSDGTTEYR